MELRRTLKPHPDTPCDAISRITVGIDRPRPSALVLTYNVTGVIADMRLPPIGVAARVDGLWRTTCFEAFVRAARSTGYCEFNFAPSTQWAAYSFTGYREGMTTPGETLPPRIDVNATAENFELKVALNLQRIPSDTLWLLALSAVIEETNGRKSYWALAHPPGKPDFHHADGFALELPTA